MTARAYSAFKFMGATGHRISVGNDPWLSAAEELARRKVAFTIADVQEQHLAAIWAFCLHHNYTPRKQEDSIFLMVPPNHTKYAAALKPLGKKSISTQTHEWIEQCEHLAEAGEAFDVTHVRIIHDGFFKFLKEEFGCTFDCDGTTVKVTPWRTSKRSVTP